MLSATWVCLLLWHGTGATTWWSRARIFETVGVLTLPVTIAAGFVDLRGIGPLTAARWDQPLIWHVLAALGGSTLFVAHAVITRRCLAGSTHASMAVDLGLATGGLWLIVLAGMLAGEMVYAT